MDKNNHDDEFKDIVDNAIMTCMAMCRLVYVHGKEVGFDEQQAMVLTANFLNGTLCSGFHTPKKKEE